MESILGSSLKRFRSMVLDPSQESAAATLTLAELDTLCSPAPEHVEGDHPPLLAGGAPVPRRGAGPRSRPLDTLRHGDQLPRPPRALHAADRPGLLEAPAEQTRELAVQLTGDWWQRGHRELFPYLLKALRDPSPQVVRAALQRPTGSAAAPRPWNCSNTASAPCRRRPTPARRRPRRRPWTRLPPLSSTPASPRWPCSWPSRALPTRSCCVASSSICALHWPEPCVPGPVREWLAKPHGKLDDLLAGYTQQELSDFR